ncbi:MAG TPA: endonuclease III [Tepiditoga sp.]|nr:endonuclease III [Tepiditoga sp.]
MRNFNKEAKIIIDNFPYVHNDTDPFRVLISTVLSQRSKDENTHRAAKNLFAKYPDCYKISELIPEDIYELIKPAGMFRQKAERIIQISKIIKEKYNGIVPGEIDELIKLPGVGRKTANVMLWVSYSIPAMAVDTHVHRISNRLGWINTKTPEASEFQLIKIIDKNLWGPLNGSMVSFGQKVCTPKITKCNLCPLADICPSSEKKKTV